MRRRPWTVSGVGWVLIAIGVVSLVRHRVTVGRGTPKLVDALGADFWYAEASAVASILGGAFVLRGATWARWFLDWPDLTHPLRPSRPDTIPATGWRSR